MCLILFMSKNASNSSLQNMLRYPLQVLPETQIGKEGSWELYNRARGGGTSRKCLNLLRVGIDNDKDHSTLKWASKIHVKVHPPSRRPLPWFHGCWRWIWLLLTSFTLMQWLLDVSLYTLPPNKHSGQCLCSGHARMTFVQLLQNCLATWRQYYYLSSPQDAAMVYW